MISCTSWTLQFKKTVRNRTNAKKFYTLVEVSRQMVKGSYSMAKKLRSAILKQLFSTGAIVELRGAINCYKLSYKLSEKVNFTKHIPVPHMNDSAKHHPQESH